jgi:hypothetical protein
VQNGVIFAAKDDNRFGEQHLVCNSQPAMGIARYPTLHRQLEEYVGERRCGFSSYNLLTQAAMMNTCALCRL